MDTRSIPSPIAVCRHLARWLRTRSRSRKAMRDVMPWRESCVIMRVGSNTPARGMNAKALPPPDFGVDAGCRRGHCHPCHACCIQPFIHARILPSGQRCLPDRGKQGGTSHAALTAMLAGKTHVSADSGTGSWPSMRSTYVQGAKVSDAKVEGRIGFR